MKQLLTFSLVAAAAACVQIQAHNVQPPEPPCLVFIPRGAAWEYTFIDPTADSSWTTTSGGWDIGNAPFSNQNDGHFAMGTPWLPEDPFDFTDDLWVRTTVDLSGQDLSLIDWDVGIDNGFTLFLNGVQVFSANKEGDAHYWDYSGTFSQALLVNGVNYLALALEDHGGGTGFDFELGSDICVPEAGSAGAMLACGFAGITFAARRFKK